MINRLSKRPEILGQWSRVPIPTEPSPAPEMRRARIIDAVVRKMQQTTTAPPMRRRVAGWMAVAAGVAAVVILGLTGWRARTQSEPVAAHLYTLFGASHAVVRGRELVSSSQASGVLPLGYNAQVATESGSSSRLQLLSGVNVSVGPETRLTLPGAQGQSTSREEIVLELGFIRVQVPKLPPGHVFAIRTPGTLVTVHGTSFSVEVTKSAPSATAKTRVIVTDGVVTVQQSGRETLLSAGMEWASPSEDSWVATTTASSIVSQGKATATSPRPAAKPEHESMGAASVPADPPAMREMATKKTELANQNRVFSEAMNLRDQGDRSAEVRLLSDFIRRYPASPLVEDAYIERFRALAQIGDHAAAARAARAYLALYQQGFARDEAREIALSSPASF
ncbi:MAG: FecR family protein [Myxococcota bacterium]|nr:FecR family protein [Myxococcota bacterium]